MINSKYLSFVLQLYYKRHPLINMVNHKILNNRKKINTNTKTTKEISITTFPLTNHLLKTLHTVPLKLEAATLQSSL